MNDLPPGVLYMGREKEMVSLLIQIYFFYII